MSVLRTMAISEWRCFIVDCDWGCGIIDTAERNTRRKIELPAKLTYERDFKSIYTYVISENQFLLNLEHP